MMSPHGALISLLLYGSTPPLQVEQHMSNASPGAGDAGDRPQVLRCLFISVHCFWHRYIVEKGDAKISKLDANQLKWLDALVGFLRPFLAATENLSKGTESVSSVIPLYYALKKNVTSKCAGLGTFVETLTTQLDNHFRPFLESDEVLSPCFVVYLPLPCLSVLILHSRSASRPCSTRDGSSFS